MKYVIYYRDKPRLPLAGQRQAAEAFVSLNKGTVVATFTEKEPTHKIDRVAFRKALETAKAQSAALVIVAIGRLSRNRKFVLALQDAGVDFVCLDMPNAAPETLHILIALAEQEARRIGQMSRNALAAAKARGVKLGSADPKQWRGREHKRGWKQAYKASIAARQRRAAEAYQFILPEIKIRRERGDTIPEIIEWLNGQGYTTTTGKPFTETAVWRIIDRYLGKEYLGNNKRKRAAAG